MEMLLAFLVGVASSAFVSYLVYQKQRRESLAAERTLLQRLAEQAEVLGVTASTTLVTATSTARLERDVAVLRRQVTSALDAGETIRQDHIELARGLLAGGGSLDERTLKELHGLLLVRDLEYAGQLRDVPIRVGGTMLEPEGLPAVPEPAQVRERLAGVLEQWAQPMTEAAASPFDQHLDRIVRLHAGLLQVHPFFDGNGLLARVLLALQTEELLGQRLLLPRRDKDYFRALRRAAEGDYEDLRSYVRARMRGADSRGERGEAGLL